MPFVVTFKCACQFARLADGSYVHYKCETCRESGNTDQKEVVSYRYEEWACCPVTHKEKLSMLRQILNAYEDEMSNDEKVAIQKQIVETENAMEGGKG